MTCGTQQRAWRLVQALAWQSSADCLVIHRFRQPFDMRIWRQILRFAQQI